MRESKKNACNDSAIIAGVLAFPVSWKILWSWFWYSILHKKYIIQKRVTTPERARELGSDYIVVGRPITQAEDPVAAYRRCVAEFVG